MAGAKHALSITLMELVTIQPKRRAEKKQNTMVFELAFGI